MVVSRGRLRITIDEIIKNDLALNDLSTNIVFGTTK